MSPAEPRRTNRWQQGRDLPDCDSDSKQAQMDISPRRSRRNQDAGPGSAHCPNCSCRTCGLTPSGAWNTLAQRIFTYLRYIYNKVTFMPVTTRSLRPEIAMQPNLSAGIREWRVK
jgi:hypothetical protein